MKKLKILILSVALCLFANISIAQQKEFVSVIENSESQPQLLEGILSQLNISLDLSQRIMNEAQLVAQSLEENVTIAIVDRVGTPILVAKNDNHGELHFEFALYKAKTAAMRKLPTKESDDQVFQLSNLENTNMLLGVAGGIPIFYQGQCIGAIGVTGAAEDVDLEIAQASLKVMRSPAGNYQK